MSDKWVNHTKKFAKDNNMSYQQALSNPENRMGYYNKKVQETSKRPCNKSSSANISQNLSTNPHPCNNTNSEVINTQANPRYIRRIIHGRYVYGQVINGQFIKK